MEISRMVPRDYTSVLKSYGASLRNPSQGAVDVVKRLRINECIDELAEKFLPKEVPSCERLSSTFAYPVTRAEAPQYMTVRHGWVFTGLEVDPRQVLVADIRIIQQLYEMPDEQWPARVSASARQYWEGAQSLESFMSNHWKFRAGAYVGWSSAKGADCIDPEVLIPQSEVKKVTILQ